MSTPLYDETLSDVLARAREQVIAAERAAAERVARAEAAVGAEVARIAALAREQVEEAVRAELAAAPPPLPSLVVRVAEVDPDSDERETPPVPAFDDLRVPAAKVSAFFDALMGPPRT